MKPPDKIDERKKGKGESLASYAYQAIKKKIVSGKLAPGNALMDRVLAEELGMSRTPIREALKKLADEGWVLWEEHKGIVVSEVTEGDEYELFLLRNMIEPYVVKMIITKKKPQILAGLLVSYIDEMEKVQDNYVEFIKIDMEFHTTIIKYLGIQKLLPLWNNICDDMTRLVVQSVHYQRPAKDAICEHKALVEAFWRADLNAALACINNHCREIVTRPHDM